MNKHLNRSKIPCTHSFLPMIASSVKELNETKAKVAKLEQALAKELASLPSAYGFESLKQFVAAIKAAGGVGKRAGRPKNAAAPKTRKRATITDAIRAKVGQLLKMGKTGSQVAKALGISLPSVQNIKKALGLVKSSKHSATDAKARGAPAKVGKKRLAPKRAIASVPNPAPVEAETARSSSV